MARFSGDGEEKNTDIAYLATNSFEIEYLIAFLENLSNPSNNNERRLDMATKSLLNAVISDVARDRFYRKMHGLLNSLIKREAYEECAVVRDLIQHYGMEIESELIDRAAQDAR